mmetsp:Transcript_6177/g.13561  ORF Transcript_6177/g.13561 Transcript_6177/m.13561 type:complete len:249 (-) Transcript_6177:313-1059(-)
MLQVVLVNGVGQVEHLDVPLVEGVHERTLFHDFDGFAGEDVDLLLPVLHSISVLLKANKIIISERLVGFEQKKFLQLVFVGGIVNTSHLQGETKLLVPRDVRVGFLGLLNLNDITVGVDLGLLRLLVILGDLRLHHLPDEFDSLSYELFLDDLDDLALLERLAVDVQRKVVGVDDALDEGEVSGHEVERVGDEHLAYVQSKARIVIFSKALLQSKRNLGRKVEDGFEVDVTLGVEVGPVLSACSSVAL